MNTTPYAPEEPIAAIATALAPAALGIVRCSGTGCIALLAKLFSRPTALLTASGNTLVYGWLCEPATANDAPATTAANNRFTKAAASSCARIDEVLIAVYRAPKSFTGEEMAEISCHGGIAVITAVYRLLLANGFRAAERGEFTFRAYINGKTDLTRAEAVREIIESKTDASRSRAAGRLAGTLYAAIDTVKRRIIDTLAAIEVEIEYPEDEETIADNVDTAALAEIARDLAVLADSWQSEKIYQDGARVVLCGRTNAGKSSLFNALLKEDRAIVSDIAGTTRDWLESWVDFGGIPARLFDTAGLRKTVDVIEQRGVALTHDLIADADVVLYIIDATVGVTADDCTFFAELHGAHETTTPMHKIPPTTEDEAHTAARTRQGTPLVLVWNKADLLENGAATTTRDGADRANRNLHHNNSAETVAARAVSHSSRQMQPAANNTAADVAPFPPCPEANAAATFAVSAQTGAGIADLCAAVRAVLTRHTHGSRAPAGLGSERQRRCVAEALERVRHALALTADYALDAVVQDLEDALDALGAVTGDVTPDDILDSVFAHFCVGK